MEVQEAQRGAVKVWSGRPGAEIKQKALIFCNLRCKWRVIKTVLLINKYANWMPTNSLFGVA